jgi:purine/pyrimidine-nucleoside phosphorylase
MENRAAESFANVEVSTKANVYFDGKVVSHTLRFSDGSKKTLGLIYPGSYHFGTEAPELMQISAGSCRVRIKGEADFKPYAAGSAFRVPANSGFDIAVDAGIAEYVCSFE